MGRPRKTKEVDEEKDLVLVEETEADVIKKLPVTTTEDRITVNTSKRILNKEREFYTKTLRTNRSFKSLTNKEIEFVVNYILMNGNSIRALEMTYPTEKNPSNKAKKLMENPKITEAIASFWKTMYADKIQRIEKGILDTYYRRAFTNPFKYFKLDGTLRKGVTEEDIGDDYVIIDGVERKIYTNNKTGEMREVVVYKLADRDKAFDRLQKILGLDVTKVSIIGDLNVKDQTSGVLRIPTEADEAEWEDLNSEA